MLVKIIGGPGAGTIADLIPAVAIARIKSGTAIPVEERSEKTVIGHVIDGVREATARMITAVRHKDPEFTREAEICE
jgi:hypothetical protein